MKLRGIFRYELAYQARRLTTWLYLAAVTVVALLFVRMGALSDALYEDFYVNSPFVIAATTVLCSLFWFITSAMVAGEVATRDAETGMHPITYTAPVSKAEYLGGRFLAAFALNTLILLGAPLGVMLAVYGPGVDPVVVGPFRAAAYLTAFGFIALPNAFVGTAIQFAFAALSRRAIAAYLGSVVLLFVAYGGIFTVSFYLEREDLAMLLDVFGHLFLTDDLILGWTPIERNTRLIALEGTLLHSRILWLGIAVATLVFTHARFRFAHPTTSPWWIPGKRLSASLRTGSRSAAAPTPGGSEVARHRISIPHVDKSFDLQIRLRQSVAIARTSFRSIAFSWIGLFPLTVLGLLVVSVLPENMDNLGTPMLPRTAHILSFLTTPLTNVLTPWIVIPLLIVVYAGELVWRERQAGLGEIADAAPVPEWVTFLGKFTGLGLVMAAWLAILVLAGVIVQVKMGYHHHEIGLYLKILFGLQLPEYLLFAVLALVVQGLVSNKYIGHLVTLLAYALIAFAPALRIGNPLAVYSASPGWSYGDMRGFGSSLEPWLWFKLYWAGWAILLAVVGKLLWMRGLERNLGLRLGLARQRFTRATARAAALAVGLVTILGGFISYNMYVLNDYTSGSERVERQAEYELRYGQYRDAPQPRLTGARLHVEIYPDRHEVEIRGSYRLVNREAVAIDSVHLATVTGVETDAIAFSRSAIPVMDDEELGHHVYRLEEPLQPGDSLSLSFEVRVESRGFAGRGYNAQVQENGTYFTSEAFLPVIGYQPGREIVLPAQRREHGLDARPLLPTLDESEGGEEWPSGERVVFEAVVGTKADQTATAPGALRRSWTEGGRRYFHYASETPIGDEWSFFSARYAVREVRWTPPQRGSETNAGLKGAQAPPGAVTIQIFHDPDHTANLDRMLRSVEESLDYYSEGFGPYPYSQIKLIENPARGFGAHSELSVIDYGESFSFFDPQIDARGMDLPFAVMAHEMAHQFCCATAPIEGAGLLSESPAWWAAMGVVERTYGQEHLERLRRFFRQPYPIPPIRQSVPLLRAMDPYAAYRKGPFALYALSEYMGEDRVFLAYRRVQENQRAERTLATSLDLYRELRAVTPDSLQTFLHDLFAANTIWELATTRAAAEQTTDGSWQVTLDVSARKVVVDSAGVETELPMDNWVQIGVFAPTGPGADYGETLYLQKHRIRSGEQTITVTVPSEPSDAGIDPYHLLIELDRFDNVEEVER